MRELKSVRGSTMCRVFHYLTLLVLFVSSTLRSQPPQTATEIDAARVHEPMLVDGTLSESVWKRPGLTAFTQRVPNEGATPSQKTEVWLAYDDAALYVAARMYDSAPDSIVRILGRRDADITADWFEFYVDPYRDRQTGFYFALSAAGTMQDGTLYNDEYNDNSWDGVWEGKARIDETGWTVEMRIPYTQLRFHQAAEYRWAVNFSRSIARTNEKDFVVYTPLKGSGFVSRFIDVKGIKDIDPPKDIEFLPYITSRAEFLQAAPGDPFNNGSKYSPGVGVDFKAALGTDLTLSASINPDFGQVEVDPAVVNLSDVETFYQEKRPFFIEGANTFLFGQGGANSRWSFNWSDPTFFYSRRIGRTPQGSLPSYDYVDMPLGTHIVGEGKLTGKVTDDWNIGMIHAVTSREFARIRSGDTDQRVEIEPLTYYGVGRIQRDFHDGRQGLGAIITCTNRFFSDARLRDEINSNALAVGIDGWQFLDADKTYVLTGWGAFSDVHGDAARITALQLSSRHYFQRPDAPQVSLDSTATRLTGYAARVALNKQKGSLRLNAALGFINPGFDVDDLGFLSRTDMINYHVAPGYRWTERTDLYNNVSINGAAFGSFDYGGNKTWEGYGVMNSWEFRNFYQFSWDYFYNPRSVDTRSTRGGPAMLSPPGWQIDAGITTDNRSVTVYNLQFMTYQGGGGQQYQAELDIDFKPLPTLELTAGPAFARNMTQAQWVTSYADPSAEVTFGNRYVFADLDQKTLSANIRLNWTFTPQLSLQLFVQPLISSGMYTRFKALARPRTFEFLPYGEGNSTLSQTRSSAGSETYSVDADGNGPGTSFDFADPDFNLRSLRGNAVLRWEYRPGSTLYFVWTQTRSDTENAGDFQFGHSLGRLVDAHPDNIFLIKFTYWWSV